MNKFIVIMICASLTSGCAVKPWADQTGEEKVGTVILTVVGFLLVFEFAEPGGTAEVCITC